MKALFDERLKKLQAELVDLDKQGGQNREKVKVLDEEFQQLTNEFIGKEGAVKEFEKMMLKYDHAKRAKRSVEADEKVDKGTLKEQIGQG